MARIVLASWLAFFFLAVPSFAADATDQMPASSPTSAVSFAAALAKTTTTPLAAAPAVADHEWYKSTRRPAILPALYVSSAFLQGYDAYSTLRALNAGGVEANPLMKGAASNPAVLIGVKAAISVTSIVAAERMWKNHNRTGAIVMMAISNGVMAFVAQHNASVINGLR